LSRPADEVLNVAGLVSFDNVAFRADPEPIEVLAMGIAEQAKMYSPERQAAIKAMLENVKKAADLLGDDK